MKLGIATLDWAIGTQNEKGHPHWGGSGWARLGKYVNSLPYDVTVGVPVGIGAPSSRRLGVREFLPGSEGLDDFIEGTNMGWNGVDHYDLDVIYLQRVMFDQLVADIDSFKKAGQSVFNDVDDWFWGLHPNNHAFRYAYLSDQENIRHYKTIVARSTAVSVSTPYLASRLSEWVKVPIEVIENTVDFSAFSPKTHTESDHPVIGWAGATSHRSGDLEKLKGVLNQLERKGFRFHHLGDRLGAEPFTSLAGVSHCSVEPIATPDVYPSRLTFDIGIAPISDHPFNLAKSAIKALEYTAAGIPYVATAMGEYLRLYEEFGIGRVAKNPKQWVKHLEALRDPELRQEEASLNKERALSLNLESGAKKLEAFIETYKE